MLRQQQRRSRLRGGFTLIELMVALALTLFLMAIISDCFVTSLTTFSQLKSIGDMDANLRTVVNNLRFDLQQDHLNAKRRLSDPDLASNPPLEGFFAIRQVTPSYSEGTDTDGLFPGLGSNAGPPTPGQGLGYAGSSYRVQSSNPPYLDHFLHFTIKLRGNRPESYFIGLVPAGSPLSGGTTNFFNQSADGLYQSGGAWDPSLGGASYSSQWAEVAYFLVYQGSSANANDSNPANMPAGATPLYGLYRAQFVVPPRTDQINNNAATAAQILQNMNYLNIACTDPSNLPANPLPLIFYGPDDMAKAPTVGYFPPAPNPKPTDYTLSYRRAFDTTFSSQAPYAPNRGGYAQMKYLGATLVANNVVSLNVQVLKAGATEFTDLGGGTPGYPLPIYDTAAGPNGITTQPLYKTNPAGVQVQAVLQPFSINALQISIRVYDLKTQGARQITLIQDM